jgi:hypothetical protein
MTEDKAVAQDKVSVKKEPAASPPGPVAGTLTEDLSSPAMVFSGQATVRLRVEGPHSGIIHNGVWVGTDWTEVPAHAVPAIMEGAVNSGVSLVQEEV